MTKTPSVIDYHTMYGVIARGVATYRSWRLCLGLRDRGSQRTYIENTLGLARTTTNQNFYKYLKFHHTLNSVAPDFTVIGNTALVEVATQLILVLPSRYCDKMDPSSPSPIPRDRPTRPSSDSALSTVKSTGKRSRNLSSRNRRTLSAASSRANSPNGSNFSMEDFTIDLAKLGEKDTSWTIGNFGKRDIERVSSHDDGPEDFTLKLGEWMKGTVPMASQDRPAAPAMTRMNTEAIEDQAAQEVFDRISALQSEVEQLRLENNDHQSAQLAAEHTHLQQQKECGILRTQIDDLRAEAKRLQASEFKTSQKALRLEQELKRDGSKVGSLRAKFEPLTQELETVKLRAEADQQAANSTIETLKEDLKASRDDATKLQADLASTASAHATEVETLGNQLQASQTRFQHREDILKEQLQAKETTIEFLKEEKTKAAVSSASSSELTTTKEQLTEARRILRNIEDENDLLTQENERQAEMIGSLQRALDEERLRISDTADAQVAELQEEITRFQNQKTTDTISYSEHRATVDKLQDDHAAATEALTAKSKKELNTLRSAIIKAGEGMKKREERIIASHAKEAGELKQHISTLQTELKNATTAKQSAPVDDDLNPAVLELRSAIRALNNRLGSTNQALREAYAEADKAKKEVQTIKEENNDINREMDGKVQKMMEDREREWRRRIKVVFKERETMGKALMMAWGREECGAAREGERQRYRYKFVDKDGKVLV
ncbi:MAG: hypothetical protein LQ338_003919 [Usnochroma carphineum]|nr:MAG: hypothetical protein LQ338_003919 [Usnochroma carphineum]